MLTQLAENGKSWGINAQKTLEEIEKRRDSKEERRASKYPDVPESDHAACGP